jgi:hypothetical protein
MFSQWLTVRQEASKHLSQRRLNDFVPDLLQLMYTPAESSLQLVLGPRNAFWIDLWVAREGKDVLQGYHLQHNDGLIFIKSIDAIVHYRSGSTIGHYRPTAESLFPETLTAQRMRTDRKRQLFDAIHAGMRQIDENNEVTANLNQRVCSALAAASGEPSSSDPKYWWRWWRDFTGYEENNKRVVQIEEGNHQDIPVFEMHGVFYVSASCLVAGTSVWTDHGFMPIERIRVGDRVLAKNIETGELAYKPVLHTTVRRPSPTFQFTVGDDSITASVGHNWWVSGSGWTKTRELRDGQPIHTATGMTRVSGVETAAEEKTYNLVVADFHTYFVGHSHILSHDVLSPRPTNRLVPGLVEE